MCGRGDAPKPFRSLVPGGHVNGKMYAAVAPARSKGSAAAARRWCKEPRAEDPFVGGGQTAIGRRSLVDGQRQRPQE